MANVVLNNTSGRQTSLHAVQLISFANVADTGVVVSNIFKLPPKAIVIGGAIDVLTASNDSGASTLNIGDPTNPTRYASAVNLKTAARTPLFVTDYVSNGADITLTPTNTGTATAGSYLVYISYIILDRATEAQPS